MDRAAASPAGDRLERRRGERTPGGSFVVALALVLVGLAPARAQVPEQIWLPDELRAELTRSVAERLRAIDNEGRLPQGQVEETVRGGIDGVAALAEELGARGLAELAPTFPDLEVPSSGSPALDTLAAFQLCSLPMDANYRDDSPRPDSYDERAGSLVMSMSIYIVSAYLRPHYLREGVTDEQADAFLGGDPMRSLKSRIQASSQLLSATERRCIAPLARLLQ